MSVIPISTKLGLKKYLKAAGTEAHSLRCLPGALIALGMCESVSFIAGCTNVESGSGLISGSCAVVRGGAHILMPPTDSFLSGRGGGRVEDRRRSLEPLLLLGGSFSGLIGFGGGVYSPNQVGPLLGGGGTAVIDPNSRLLGK